MPRTKRNNPLADLELVSLADLASRWHVSRSTVRRALRRVGIRTFIIGPNRNGSLRFALIDIDEYLRKQESTFHGHRPSSAAPGGHARDLTQL